MELADLVFEELVEELVDEIALNEIWKLNIIKIFILKVIKHKL
jgi:hypothetical protein